MRFNLKACGLLLVGLSALLTPPISQAELIVSEDFNYAAGSLKEQGGWIQAVAASNTDVIDVVAGKALSYPGYQNQAVGNAVQITTQNSANSANTNFALKASNDYLASGTVYAAFLLKVEAVPSSGHAFLVSFAGANKNGFAQYNTGLSQVGSIHVGAGSTDGKFALKGRKSVSVASAPTIAEYNIGETLLIVMGYEFVSGSTNDVVSVWVNPPVDSQTPPADPDYKESTGADVNATYGVQGVRLYQYNTGSNRSPEAVIDALRMATSWSDLFGGGGETPVDKPVISVTPSAVNFGALMSGAKVTETVNVKGEKLKGDISIVSGSSEVAVNPTTVSAEAAAEGVDVTLTYTAGSASLNSTLTLSSEDADDVTVGLTSAVTPVTDETRIAALNLLPNETYDLYRYTGTMAKVSYVDEAQKMVYVQDMTGATRLNYEMLDAAPYQTGDKIKNFVVYRYDSFGPQFMLVDAGTVTSSGNEVTPVEATFATLAASKDEYAFKLVTVTDVTVTESGKTWAAGAAASQTVNGTTTTGRVRTFAGTDLASETIPDFIPAVTGVMTSATAVIITARSQADVTSAPANLEISRELKVDANAYQEIGKTVEFAVFTVKATAMTKPTAIYLTGTNRDQFSLSREEIPAGTGLYQVTVSYKPTKPGTHKANILFDAVPTELSGSYAISAKAYDPANPPVITVNTEGLTDFVAGVGSKQEQTIKYTVTNGLDYGTVKVSEGGGFIISSGSLMMSGTYDLRISFEPKAEGEYERTITFSSPMAQDVTVTVKGKTNAGPAPEEKEGDELTFEGPALKQYSTDFTTATANNKPIKMDGWKNVAIEGTRAWWSYTKDGNQMAKAVAYDSKASAPSPLTMMLMSPRLDYTNADQRLLCFKVMGDMMTEGMVDRLAVGFIDPAEVKAGQDVPVNFFSGLNIPMTEEENGEWASYVLDMEQMDLPAEFYIAFVYLSERGKDSTAQYYVDDFSWGRTDVPFIRSSHQLIEHTCAAGATSTLPEVTVTGFNLNSPISVAMGGSDAKCFTLSTQELPAEGGTFSLSFASDEQREHTALVELKSGSDALTYMMVNVDTRADGIEDVTAGGEWAEPVSVYDLEGRVLVSNARADEAVEYMKSRRGTLFVVRTPEGAFKYMAK